MIESSSQFLAYSDNFKGAPDGWHRLKKVNFLVGENSTGKSSFQQLFKIVSSQPFVFTLDAFGIIPSISSPTDIIGRLTDRPHVSIGFAAIHSPGPEEEDRFFGRIVTYLDIEGTLMIAGVTFATSEYTLTVYRDAKSKFKFRKDDATTCDALMRAPEILEGVHKKAILDSDGVDLELDDYAFDSEGWLSAIFAAVKKIGARRYLNPMQTPQIFRALSYGPSRRAPQRLLHGDNTVFNSTGAHAPFILKDILPHIPEIEGKLRDYGVSSGLFDYISIDEVETKVKDKPFIITVGKGGKHFYVDELGYGISQILPVAIDILVSHEANTLLIQQPELHLHPRAQAELGSYIHRNSKDGPNLVIETHSDFIIDRFRVEQAKATDDEKIDAQVLFFTSGGSRNRNQVCVMDIMEDGSFSTVPDDYRSFFLDENMLILGTL